METVIKRENPAYGNMKWLLEIGLLNNSKSRQWFMTKKEAIYAEDLCLKRKNENKYKNHN